MPKYAVGHNQPGYLPDGDVYYCDTFEHAREVLAGDLDDAADAAHGPWEGSTEAVEQYTQAMREVEHWTEPGDIQVGGTVYFIQETED